MAMRKKNSSIPPEPWADEATGNWRPELDATLDAFSLKNLYYSEPWVYILCSIAARKISNQLMTVHRRVIRKGDTILLPDDGHFLNDYLRMPNDKEDYHAFMYKVVTELCNMGNAIIWRLRFHNQFILFPTEMVDVRFDHHNKIESYIINHGLLQETNPGHSIIEIHPDDIIHVRLPNVNSMIWGLSPFVAGRKDVLFDRYSSEYKNNFYLKQANPGMILEMGDAANEKKALRFIKQVESVWTGRRNLRRTMVLPKGVKSVSHAQTLAEQDLKDHILLNADRIRALIAAPPHEFGTQTTGSLGSDEAKIALKNFWDSTCIPWQRLISGAFNLSYRKELGPKNQFGFDNSDVAVLRADEKEKAETANLMLSTHTLNEVRTKVYDLPVLEGGDSLPSGQSNQQNQPFMMGPPGQGPINVTPPNQPALPAPNEEDEELPDEPPEDKVKMFLDKNAMWWEKRKQEETIRISTVEKDVMKNVLHLFSVWAPVALEIIKENYEQPIKSAREKQNEQIPFQLQSAFSQFSEVFTNANVRTLQGSAELGYDQQLQVPFNLPNREAIEALRAGNQFGRLLTLQSRGLFAFDKISQTTTNDIMSVIRRGAERSATLAEVSKDIQTYFSQIVPSRADTIARTETLTAVSLGQKAAQDDASSLVPGMAKMWISAGDDRVRDSHQDLDGVIVGVDEDFKSNLAFPRDPRAPADETINCRCTWLMVPPDDLESLDFSGVSFQG